MGNSFGNSLFKMSEKENDIPTCDYFEIDGANGYILHEKFIPEEVLVYILSLVDPRDLVFNCRRVCKSWCNIIDHDVWKFKCARKNIDLQKLGTQPWFVCFWIVSRDVLNRNLIKNGCGQEDLNHWEVLSSGGDKWTVEKPPHGATDLPKDIISEELQKSNSCFTTSYYSCSKKQVIDLQKEGAIPHFMDTVQPHITISEWYCGRFDCRSIYELKVALLDENKDPVEEYEISKNVGGPDGGTWEQVVHVFDSYSSGVRYVEFYHSGTDSQFWAGHYGSKMTGASVVLSLP